MPRGGSRAGAGRKPGAHNKASQARQRAVAESGATPLDVLLKRMRYHHRRADECLAKDDDAGAERHMKEADDAANRAAPYVHPKLATVAHTGPNGGAIQFEKIDLTGVPDEELAALKAFYSRLAATGSDDESNPSRGGETTH